MRNPSVSSGAAAGGAAANLEEEEEEYFSPRDREPSPEASSASEERRCHHHGRRRGHRGHRRRWFSPVGKRATGEALAPQSVVSPPQQSLVSDSNIVMLNELLDRFLSCLLYTSDAADE